MSQEVSTPSSSVPCLDSSFGRQRGWPPAASVRRSHIRGIESIPRVDVAAHFWSV
jgi:hypothetical protein